MRRLFALFAFLTLPLHASDFKDATPAELAMKDCAIAPGASAVVLDWEQHRDDIDGRETEYVRIKVLKDDGKKYGDVEVKYVPTLTNVERIKARLTKPDGKVVPWQGKVYDKTIVKTGGVRLAAKTFTIPDVQPGSIIEYRYDLGFRGNYLWDTRFTVQRDLPVLHLTLWLRPYVHLEFKSFFTYAGLPPGMAPMLNGDHYELDLVDEPAFEKEPFAPPDEELKPQVEFFYYLSNSSFEPDPFWKKPNEKWTDTIEHFIGDRSGIRTAAQQMVSGATTSEEKLRKIYARVQQVRNLTFEPDKTEQEEKKLRDNGNVEDVLRNGYGWRDEITRLFVALARGAGFQAYDVRIGDRSEGFFSKSHPVADQLNNEIAAVSVDGKMRLFDPSTPYAPFGLLSWEKTRVPGLRIAKREGPTWVQSPEDPADRATVSRKSTLHFDGDTLKAAVVVTRTGHEALVKRLALRNDDDAAAKKSLEDAAKTWFADGSGVTLTKVTGLRNAEEPLVEEYDVTLPTTGSMVGTRALVPMSVCTVARKPVFPSEKRKYDVYFDYESRVDDDVTLEIPAGYTVESLPNASNLDYGAVTYKTQYVRGDKTVHYTRHATIETLFIEKGKYAVVRNFFNAVATADQDQVVLRKVK